MDHVNICRADQEDIQYTNMNSPNEGNTYRTTKGKLSVPKSLAAANPKKAAVLRQTIHNSVKLPRESELVYPYSITKEMSGYSLQLPNMEQYSTSFQDILEEALIDRHMRMDLEEARIINFIDSIRPLYPLKTAGDGNCLLHAVSRGIWGVHDNNTFLRRLVYFALVEDTCGRFKERWRRQQTFQDQSATEGGISLNSQEWDMEWERLVCAAEDTKHAATATKQLALPYESLQEIHIFVLANVLRRPIVILAESVYHGPMGHTLAPNNFGGIYLPLLWEPSQCVSNPLVLSFHMCHFTPCVTTEHRGVQAGWSRWNGSNTHAVPLVRHDFSPLHVHFLREEEHNSAHILIQNYLRVDEVTSSHMESRVSILVALMAYKPLPDHLNLMPDFLSSLQKYEKQTSKHHHTSGLMGVKSQLEPKKHADNSDNEGLHQLTTAEGVQLSAVDQLCSFSNCPNQSSITTAPFCHEHTYYSILRPGREPKTTHTVRSPSEEVSSKSKGKLLIGLQEPGVTNSLELDHLQGGSPCWENGCPLYGLPKWNNRCMHHYKEARPGQSLEKHSTQWHKCRSLGCKYIGKSRYNGCCSECYAKRMLETQDAPHHLKELKDEDNSLSDSDEDDSSPRLPVGFTEAQIPEDPSCANQQYYEKILCAGPQCKRPWWDSKTKLCFVCSAAAQVGKTKEALQEDIALFSRVQELQNLDIHGPPCLPEAGIIQGKQSEENPQNSTQPATVPCPGPCGQNGLANLGGLCHVCYDKLHGHRIRSDDVESNAEQCIQPGCQQQAESHTGGYCKLCKLTPCCTEHHSPRTAPKTIFNSKSKSKMSAQTPPYSQSRIATVDEQSTDKPIVVVLPSNTCLNLPFVEAVTIKNISDRRACIEESLAQWNQRRLEKGKPSKCRTRHCHNFGNVKCSGFCNACLIKRSK